MDTNCNSGCGKVDFTDLFRRNLTIGNLPSSYLASMSYEEQLLYLSKDIKEIVKFINCVLNKEIINYINNMFNEIMLNAMYEQDTETLVLYLDKPIQN